MGPFTINHKKKKAQQCQMGTHQIFKVEILKYSFQTKTLLICIFMLFKKKKETGSVYGTII